MAYPWFVESTRCRISCTSVRIFPKKEPKTRLRKLKAMATLITGVRMGEKNNPARLQLPFISREAGPVPAMMIAVFCRGNLGKKAASSSIE